MAVSLTTDYVPLNCVTKRGKQVEILKCGVVFEHLTIDKVQEINHPARKAFQFRSVFHPYSVSSSTSSYPEQIYK